MGILIYELTHKKTPFTMNFYMNYNFNNEK